MNIPQTKIYSALSNETRLRCLYLTSKLDEVCVCDVVDTLRISQPTASKSLGTLRSVGLLADRKDANWIYYRINQDMAGWMRSIMDITTAELDHSSQFLTDREQIRKLVSGDSICI